MERQDGPASVPGSPASVPGAVSPNQRRIPELRGNESPKKDSDSAEWILRRMLETETPELRMLAAETWPISEEDAEAVRLLIGQLSDPSAIVRSGARQRLSEVEKSQVFAYTMRTLSSGTLTDVTALNNALPMLGDFLNPLLIETLRTELETEEHRRLAAYCLGRTGAREAKDLLTENLRGENTDLARTCLDALATLLPPGTTPTWLELLDHADPYFKTRAVRALAALGEPGSFEALRSIVLGQSYPDMQGTALQAVQNYPAEMLVPLLIEVMETNRSLAPRALQALRNRTGIDLGHRPGPWREWLNNQLAGPPAPLVPAR